MHFSDWKELEDWVPIQNGIWNKARLLEYLIQSRNITFQKQINDFFSRYEADETLAALLFDILLDDDYDGSDSQMGAARYISKLSRDVLRKNRERLLEAQANEVFWKRPLPFLKKSFTHITFFSHLCY